MLQTLTVENFKGETLTLDLFHPEDSGLIIQNIEGLGPPKADILTTEFGTTDGSYFTHARANNRNIVITLAMMFIPQIEDARQKTYRYFPLKKKLKLTVKTDNRTLECEGYVESNEPVIFSEQETTQISIICPDPYLYDPYTTERAFSGVMGLFEFPFIQDDLDVSDDHAPDLFEFGELRTDTTTNYFYSGDVDIGFIMRIYIQDDDVRQITLFNITTQEQFKIDTDKIETIVGSQLKTDDEIVISTIVGQKGIRLLREGKYTNIIGAIERNASWFQLTPGDNVFAFRAESGEKHILMNFQFRNAYGGI